jgi:hypothetical protein
MPCAVMGSALPGAQDFSRIFRSCSPGNPHTPTLLALTLVPTALLLNSCCWVLPDAHHNCGKDGSELTSAAALLIQRMGD